MAERDWQSHWLSFIVHNDKSLGMNDCYVTCPWYSYEGETESSRVCWYDCEYCSVTWVSLIYVVSFSAISTCPLSTSLQFNSWTVEQICWSFMLQLCFYLVCMMFINCMISSLCLQRRKERQTVSIKWVQTRTRNVLKITEDECGWCFQMTPRGRFWHAVWMQWEHMTSPAPMGRSLCFAHASCWWARTASARPAWSAPSLDKSEYFMAPLVFLWSFSRGIGVVSL